MDKVAIIGATNAIGRQAVEQFSMAGYDVLAAHYEDVEVPNLPGVEYIFIQPGIRRLLRISWSNRGLLYYR
ncbi:hypothetical protein PML80_06705 [Aerococcus urinaeequi]|uniref:Uncharacterized protein n=1 Tax=Aerococcus urinaeequi TaxID=51665 RepID=A0AAF0BDW8_9LACT|nr:hypothetical protein [Aerococcus urinaeequi]WCG37213.1 hypothetical protein PML80_06705 [Aerococcus urinaeequi]